MAALNLGRLDDFQDGTFQGWGGGDFLENIPTGGPLGNGDRFLQATSDGGDGAGSRLATFNAEWSGDLSAAGVTAVEMDIRNQGNVTLEMRIVMFGTNADRWTSTNAAILPVGSGWQHVKFSLEPGALTRVRGFGSYLTSYTSVSQIMVRHDPGAPSSQGAAIASQMGVDNVLAGGNPWPMERFDRWGSGRNSNGPNIGSLTTPWTYKSLDFGTVSHGPSLDASGRGYAGSWQSVGLIRFDIVTGSILDTFTTNAWGQSTPVLSTDLGVYFGAVDPNGGNAGRLFRLGQLSLGQEWQIATGAVKVDDWSSCSPVIGPDGNTVYGSTTGSVWKMTPAGTEAWRVTGLGSVMHTPVFTRDDALVIVSNGGKVTAINYSTGTTAWEATLNSTAGAPGAAPNGTIVVGSTSGTVYGLNPTNGAVTWSFSAGGPVLAAPAFSLTSGIAYLCSYDRKLYAVNAATGAISWTFTGLDENRAAPTVGTEGRIYFGTMTGLLYCVNENGTEAWHYSMGGAVRGPISLGPDGTLYVPNGLLRIIKQQPTFYEINSILMEKGTLTSGGPPELKASDNSYVRMQGPVKAQVIDPSVRSIFTATSPYAAPTRFSVVVEAAVTVSNVRQTIDLLDTQTGLWVNVDTRNAPQADTSIQIDVNSNAERFMDPVTKAMKIRMAWRQIGPIVVSTTIQARVDVAKFINIVPGFGP